MSSDIPRMVFWRKPCLRSLLVLILEMGNLCGASVSEEGMLLNTLVCGYFQD